ncbi:MAG: hypothetical protein ACPLRH_08085, partial [Desulfotomaculales bacterium]
IDGGSLCCPGRGGFLFGCYQNPQKGGAMSILNPDGFFLAAFVTTALVFLWVGALVKGKLKGKEAANQIYLAGKDVLYLLLCRTLWYVSWGLLFLNVFTFLLAVAATVLLYVHGSRLEAVRLAKPMVVFFLMGFFIAFGGMVICCLADPRERLNPLYSRILRLTRWRRH